MNRTLRILLAVSGPSGFIIAACSAVLTVNFVTLGVQEPSTPLEFIVFFARIGGGISVTLAQIFGFILHRVINDKFSGWLYRGATAISVYMSICTFYSMIQAGNIDALASAKQQAKKDMHESIAYKNLMGQVDYSAKMISAIEAERKKTNDIYDKYNRVTKKIKANEAYDAKVKHYEDMRSEAISELKKYDAQPVNTHGEQITRVTIGQIYILMAKDIVKFCNLRTGAEERIKMVFQYFLLIFFSILIDLTGTSLILCGVKRAYLAKKIIANFDPDIDIDELDCPLHNEGVSPVIFATLDGAKCGAEQQIDVDVNTREKRQIVPEQNSIKSIIYGGNGTPFVPDNMQITGVDFYKNQRGQIWDFDEKKWGETMGSSCGGFCDFVPVNNARKSDKTDGDKTEQKQIDHSDEKVKNIFSKLDTDVISRAFFVLHGGLNGAYTLSSAQKFVFGYKNSNTGRIFKEIADAFSVQVPGGANGNNSRSKITLS